jgi:hypothetical protein
MQSTPAPAPLISGEWREQELLLMREVMRLVGRSPAPGLALRTMLHLMSELLGLNRGRIVLSDPPGPDPGVPRSASIQHAYGLTRHEVARGRYLLSEGITGRVLAARLMNTQSPSRPMPKMPSPVESSSKLSCCCHRELAALSRAKEKGDGSDSMSGN